MFIIFFYKFKFNYISKKKELCFHEKMENLKRDYSLHVAIKGYF